MTSLRRRTIVTGAVCGAAIGVAAQPTARPRVALLTGSRPADSAPFVDALVAELRTLGYDDGRTMDFDAGYADYSEAQGQRVAAQIAARKPAVIVASSTGIDLAYRLSPPIPVVFVHSGNPVDAGYVDSLPRPGRHATGISLMALDLIAKRMEFLRQLRPNLRRLALIASPEHAGLQRELAASRAGAAALGLDVSYHEARTPTELTTLLPQVAQSRPDAALLFSDALMFGQRESLAAFFLDRRIPSGAGFSAFPDSGHVMSYGPERKAVWRRAAHFVDRIVKGARPSELPVELPTVFELVINRRSAKAMGLVVPPQLALLADRVID
jgi:putative ABC transport system substrate-binding protein